MVTPTYYLLHVADPEKSSGFYAGLFGRPPVETSATFVLFVLDGGIKVGLWSRDTVEPATGGAPGALEIGIALKAPAEVDAFHESWLARGLPVFQPPTDMDFGRSMMVTDPDGHRIRLFAVTM
ncbi:Glyoxalase/bleomycin resistance protein/dioxygenase [uncultured Pleomorphomonas sp.]|uniref:Glyoxalase/bleomycin resistance protein/dioxygenase n=1 Tax=uncultured Pleomorphomonas sp. TaxID=442121 RepID=A0A212L582_9HYPH|nr:VOC family protein [uncultured Pleomorphomonas sp.]SCM72734.1 Glyoxalase/bleomycin resistance protein/dioxygenase [uncultured Pleomorphomonas sp.]